MRVLINWNTSDLLTGKFRHLVFQDIMLRADRTGKSGLYREQPRGYGGWTQTRR